MTNQQERSVPHAAVAQHAGVLHPWLAYSLTARAPYHAPKLPGFSGTPPDQERDCLAWTSRVQPDTAQAPKGWDNEKGEKGEGELRAVCHRVRIPHSALILLNPFDRDH